MIDLIRVEHAQRVLLEPNLVPSVHHHRHETAIEVTVEIKDDIEFDRSKLRDELE